jgi:hypothetical protein
VSARRENKKSPLADRSRRPELVRAPRGRASQASGGSVPRAAGRSTVFVPSQVQHVLAQRHDRSGAPCGPGHRHGTFIARIDESAAHPHRHTVPLEPGEPLCAFLAKDAAGRAQDPRRGDAERGRQRALQEPGASRYPSHALFVRFRGPPCVGLLRGRRRRESVRTRSYASCVCNHHGRRRGEELFHGLPLRGVDRW